MGRKPKSWDELFFQKVAPPDNRGCKLWIGCEDGKGYGITCRGSAHRIAWTLLVGPIPKGMCVLHKCDVPRCVNVDHLFLGTQTENMADMRRKGRDSKAGLTSSDILGEDAIGAKLSEQQAMQALSRVASGETMTALGREFGVTRQAISMIVNGKNWPHLPRPLGLPPVKPRQSQPGSAA